MSEASPTCAEPTCKATGACICSPVSAAGPTLSNLPAGTPTDLFGQALPPANPSVRRGSGKARRTKDTSGRCSFGSSESASLQRCLASRLLLTTDTDGSPEYEMTWKKRAMQSGAPICRLAARARRYSGKGYGGWPAPQARDRGRLPRKTKNPHAGEMNLDEKVMEFLGGWAAPCSTDGKRGHDMTDKQRHRKQGQPKVLNYQVTESLIGWAGPKARDHKGNGVSIARCGERCSGLSGLAMQAGVPQWNGPTIAALCSDGPRRVSSEPDAFPLADGIPGRMGLLRGAGNAIVPQVAAKFIRAFLEAEAELMG